MPSTHPQDVAATEPALYERDDLDRSCPLCGAGPPQRSPLCTSGTTEPRLADHLARLVAATEPALYERDDGQQELRHQVGNGRRNGARSVRAGRRSWNRWSTPAISRPQRSPLCTSG